MFALRVRYLTGRVCASVFDDGDAKQKVEWPPHPGRLFSALVASWGEAGAEAELRPVLEWLERQPSPVLHYHPEHARDRVTNYVPVNDMVALPEDRPRKGRTFPSAFLPKPEAWFVWPDAIPAHLEAAMDTLLRRTPSLGHSASLVSIEIAHAVPDGLRQLVPTDGPGARRLRVIGEGRLATLERSYARFRETSGKVDRPSRGRTALYSEPGETGPVPPQGLFRDIVVLRRQSGQRATLASTLLLTGALRGAVMRLGPQPSPEVISGHPADNAVRSERPHISFVPLPTVDSRHADGEIGGLAVLLPRDLSGDERDMVLDAARQVEELHMPFGVWTVEHSDLEEPRVNLLPTTWTQASRIWVTVTPYVFDRYPDDPYGEDARATVCRSIERMGLPRPSAVSLMKTSVLIGVPPSPAFPAMPARPGKPQRFHLHAMITFDQQIVGPLVAGAGRFYGYGLFRPKREDA